MMDTAIILAAGKNTRFDTGIPKSLQELNGRTLLERQIRQLHANGFTRVAVVVGFRGGQIAAFIEVLNPSLAHPITVVWNHQFERANAWSILAAEAFIGDGPADAPFLVAMADHVFADDFHPALRHRATFGDEDQPTLRLAVDRPGVHNRHIDLEDVTRVKTEGARIVTIGKGLADYDAYDTGCFLMRGGILPAIREAVNSTGDSISNAVSLLASRGEAQVIDLTGTYWSDVDTPADFRAAQTASALQKGVDLP